MHCRPTLRVSVSAIPALVLAACLTASPACAQDTTPSDADFDGSGFVDGLDFLIWQQNAGGAGTQATGDANGDNVYELEVEVDDGTTTVTKGITVTVSDANGCDDQTTVQVNTTEDDLGIAVTPLPGLCGGNGRLAVDIQGVIAVSGGGCMDVPRPGAQGRTGVGALVCVKTFHLVRQFQQFTHRIGAVRLHDLVPVGGVADHDHNGHDGDDDHDFNQGEARDRRCLLTPGMATWSAGPGFSLHAVCLFQVPVTNVIITADAIRS